MSEIGGLIDKVKSSVEELRSLGVKDELVLVVPYMLYMSYIDHVWEEVKQITGVDHVERSEDGFPYNVEAVVMQRSEYLRMFIKSLGEKESDVE